MECNKDQIIKKLCTCTYSSCSKKGKCCECIAYHKKNGEVPGCLFPPEIEKTYDRSIANFIRAHTKGISS
jgi:hypothetical protein